MLTLDVLCNQTTVMNPRDWLWGPSQPQGVGLTHKGLSIVSYRAITSFLAQRCLSRVDILTRIQAIQRFLCRCLGLDPWLHKATTHVPDEKPQVRSSLAGIIDGIDIVRLFLIINPLPLNIPSLLPQYPMAYINLKAYQSSTCTLFFGNIHDITARSALSSHFFTLKSWGSLFVPFPGPRIHFLSACVSRSITSGFNICFKIREPSDRSTEEQKAERWSYDLH